MARSLINDLQDLCLLWQKRLRLMDWKVKVRLARFSELGDAIARIDPELDSKRAVLSLLCKDDFDAGQDPEFPETYESLVVHELLHLHLYPLTMSEKEPILAEEQAIECIADALLTAYKTKT